MMVATRMANNIDIDNHYYGGDKDEIKSLYFYFLLSKNFYSFLLLSKNILF
jgi:hypothetical protein